ncbi:MAG: hypothetical protein KBF80_07685 [Flavobacteriales bacterium]|nr:hypothetical protein [Flavobacteriales bacterium]
MGPSHPWTKFTLLAVAAFFSGLLLSTVVLPTVFQVSLGKAMAAPAPVEEEQSHGREVLKSAIQDHRDWAGAALCLGQRMKALFGHGDEPVPPGPIGEVLLRPPRTA